MSSKPSKTITVDTLMLERLVVDVIQLCEVRQSKNRTINTELINADAIVSSFLANEGLE